MHVEQLKIKPEEAGALLRKYKEHKAHQTPVDWEIQRLARLISVGQLVIRGQGSVLGAGLNASGLPKLGIARADSTHAYLQVFNNGSGVMSDSEQVRGTTSKLRYMEFPADTFARGNWNRHKAIVPHIPPDVRPHRGLANYTILWEAEWSRHYPVDPILARRIGKSDFFLVVAQWDLTDLERQVLMSRIGQ